MVVIVTLVLLAGAGGATPPSPEEAPEEATAAETLETSSSSTGATPNPVSDPLADPADAKPAPDLPGVPVPARATVGDIDSAALAVVLILQEALASADDEAIAAATLGLAVSDDPRLVPVLLGLSHRDVGTKGGTRVRQAALAGLGRYPKVPVAVARLREALRPDAPIEDALTALPILLEQAATGGAAVPFPCPSAEGAACVDDHRLFEAYLAWIAAAGEDATKGLTALKALGDLADPRLAPLFVRLSQSGTPEQSAAVSSLVAIAQYPRARARLLILLAEQRTPELHLEDVPEAGEVGEVGGVRPIPIPLLILDGVAQQPPTDQEATAAVLEARARAVADSPWAHQLEEVLRRRDAPGLEALLAAEAAARAAPRPFDTANRWVLSLGAGAAGALGGGVASAVAADAVSAGSGGFYQWWGGLAGGLSAGAITWFALGDQHLESPSLALGLSGGVLGAFAGFALPFALNVDLSGEDRHPLYSAAGGGLLGLGVATAVGQSAGTSLSAADVAEFDLTVLAVNTTVAGVLLAVGNDDDPQILAASLVGSAVVSAGLGALAAWKLETSTPAHIHAGVAGGIGVVAGAFAGASASAGGVGGPLVTGGGALLGVATGVGTALTLGAFQLAPTDGGLVFETYAAVVGGLVGGGIGLGVQSLGGVDTTGALPLGLTAGGMVAGAMVTAALPDGLRQEPTDLILQPLFVSLALWHAGIAATAGGLNDQAVGAAFLLAPALTSAGIVAASPFVSADYGDLVLMTSTMAWGAWLSANAIASADARGPVPSVAWILGTALAMDVGAGVGVALSLSGVEDVGWRTAYVTAVSAGTVLVLALPGSLLATSSDGALAVSDVLLASSALGLVVGFVTMPLIDFRVAPDLGLNGGRHDTTVSGVDVTPTAWLLPPVPGRTDAPAVVGAIVTF